MSVIYKANGVRRPFLEIVAGVIVTLCGIWLSIFILPILAVYSVLKGTFFPNK